MTIMTMENRKTTPDPRDWFALWMGWQAAFWMLPHLLRAGEGTATRAMPEDAEWEENLPV